MSKARLVWEAMKRDAENEIEFERRVRLGVVDSEDYRALTLDAQVDLAGMAAVFLEAES